MTYSTKIPGRVQAYNGSKMPDSHVTDSEDKNKFRAALQDKNKVPGLTGTASQTIPGSEKRPDQPFFQSKQQLPVNDHCTYSDKPEEIASNILKQYEGYIAKIPAVKTREDLRELIKSVASAKLNRAEKYKPEQQLAINKKKLEYLKAINARLDELAQIQNPGANARPASGKNAAAQPLNSNLTDQIAAFTKLIQSAIDDVRALDISAPVPDMRSLLKTTLKGSSFSEAVVNSTPARNMLGKLRIERRNANIATSLTYWKGQNSNPLPPRTDKIEECNHQSALEKSPTKLAQCHDPILNANESETDDLMDSRECIKKDKDFLKPEQKEQAGKSYDATDHRRDELIKCEEIKQQKHAEIDKFAALMESAISDVRALDISAPVPDMRSLLTTKLKNSSFSKATTNSERAKDMLHQLSFELSRAQQKARLHSPENRLLLENLYKDFTKCHKLIQEKARHSRDINDLKNTIDTLKVWYLRKTKNNVLKMEAARLINILKDSLKIKQEQLNLILTQDAAYTDLKTGTPAAREISPAPSIVQLDDIRKQVEEYFNKVEHQIQSAKTRSQLREIADNIKNCELFADGAIPGQANPFYLERNLLLEQISSKLKQLDPDKGSSGYNSKTGSKTAKTGQPDKQHYRFETQPVTPAPAIHTTSKSAVLKGWIAGKVACQLNKVKGFFTWGKSSKTNSLSGRIIPGSATEKSSTVSARTPVTTTIRMKNIDSRYETERDDPEHKHFYREDAKFIKEEIDKNSGHDNFMFSLSNRIERYRDLNDKTNEVRFQNLEKYIREAAANKDKNPQGLLKQYMKEKIPGTVYFEEYEHTTALSESKKLEKIRIEQQMKKASAFVQCAAKNNNLIDSNSGQVISTENYVSNYGSAGKNSAIFVLDQQHKLSIAKHVEKEINGEILAVQHTSLARGEGVMLAGDIQIANGKITAITGESGHYRPDGVTTINGVYLLSKKYPGIFHPDAHVLLRRDSSRPGLAGKTEVVPISVTKLIEDVENKVNNDEEITSYLSQLNCNDLIDNMYATIEGEEMMEEPGNNKWIEDMYRELSTQLWESC